MKNILVIIKKQIKDTMKNTAVLIQFIIFPVLTLIMENAIKMDDMPPQFFTKLFSVMAIGMTTTSVAAIISEEKEKNTLRVLMMSNVKPWEYLLGIGIYVWTICMLGAGLMSTCLNKENIPFYLVVMGLGYMLSIVAGACVGIYAKNQMVATSLAMPLMMILSFLPMLALFNENIKKVARFFYTQQLRSILDEMTFDSITREGVIILAVNMIVVITAFFVIFRKKGLE
ncbi:ABC-2 type transport system permease protein [Lachnospiraceae bacterium NE2001]|nr:ABC-2 type transport system permease protein [Lachnospiraceae bacterium NE2001]